MPSDLLHCNDLLMSAVDAEIRHHIYEVLERGLRVADARGPCWLSRSRPGVTAVVWMTLDVSFRPLSMVGSAFRWLSHPLSKVSHKRNNTEQQG